MKAGIHHSFVKRSISAAAAVAVLLTYPLASQAQQAGQQAPPTKPATQEELFTYTTMAGINMCMLAQAKVPFKSAVQANVQMLVSVITQKHGGLVPGSTTKLTEEQVANFVLAQSILQTDRFCGKTIPAEWKKDFDGLLTQIKSVVEKAPKK